jgi:hypothetical protein
MQCDRQDAIKAGQLLKHNTGMLCTSKGPHMVGDVGTHVQLFSGLPVQPTHTTISHSKHPIAHAPDNISCERHDAAAGQQQCHSHENNTDNEKVHPASNRLCLGNSLILLLICCMH